MPKCLLTAALLWILAVSASAQDAKRAAPSALELATQHDHQLMMEALKIKALRPARTAGIAMRRTRPTTTSRRRTPTRTCPTP